MATILPIDEISALKMQEISSLPRKKDGKVDKDDAVDIVFAALLYAYRQGVDAANEMMSASVLSNSEDEYREIYKRIAGKTFAERVIKYVEDDTFSDIGNVIRTEMHRLFNDGANITARKAGATQKTWISVMDDVTRDTHSYLDGQTIGIDEDFYTYTGAHAPYPGLFGEADEDCNCRCSVWYK